MSCDGHVTCVQVKSRLEQLDDMEEGSVRETLNLNQAEYLRKIEELNRNLVNSWDNDQRVKALKIAIQVLATALTDSTVMYTDSTMQYCTLCLSCLQCSKLLIDTTVIQFYPSKYVLITDILDNFGQLYSPQCQSQCVLACSALPCAGYLVSVCDSMQCPPLCRLPGI